MTDRVRWVAIHPGAFCGPRWLLYIDGVFAGELVPCGSGSAPSDQWEAHTGGLAQRGTLSDAARWLCWVHGCHGYDHRPW
jgi:hypothetical protein